MNEVEVAPIPEEKHVWVQPRVVRPTKPKKAPAVNYMSEWGLCPLPQGCGGGVGVRVALLQGCGEGSRDAGVVWRGLQVSKQWGTGQGVAAKAQP